MRKNRSSFLPSLCRMIGCHKKCFIADMVFGAQDKGTTSSLGAERASSGVGVGGSVAGVPVGTAVAAAPVRSKRSKWADADSSPASGPSQPPSSVLPPPLFPPPAVLPPPPYPPPGIEMKVVESHEAQIREQSPPAKFSGFSTSPAAADKSGQLNQVSNETRAQASSGVRAVGEKSKWADDTPPASPPPASPPPPARSKWARDSPGSPETAAATSLQGGNPAVTKSARSKWADDSPVAASPNKAETPGVVGNKADAEGLIRAAKATGDAGAALDLLESGLRGPAGRAGGNEIGDAEVVEVEGGGVEGGEFGAGDDGADAEGGDAGALGGAAESLRQGNGLHRCREVDKAYQKLNKIDEGTYGVVYRARFCIAFHGRF